MNEFSGNTEKSAPANRTTAGPLDAEEVIGVKPYIDFGSIRLISRDEMQLRLEVEESTQRVVAVTIDFKASSLQLQAFAAPRSEGMWHEVRQQLTESIKAQNGQVEERIGPFGPELIAKLPQFHEGGASAGHRLARFIGVDGPRWFLRGIVGGAALNDALAAAEIDDIFRSVVVVRGDTPVPPKDLLELRLPDGVIAPPRVVQS